MTDVTEVSNDSLNASNVKAMGHSNERTIEMKFRICSCWQCSVFYTDELLHIDELQRPGGHFFRNSEIFYLVTDKNTQLLLIWVIFPSYLLFTHCFQ